VDWELKGKGEQSSGTTDVGARTGVRYTENNEGGRNFFLRGREAWGGQGELLTLNYSFYTTERGAKRPRVSSTRGTRRKRLGGSRFVQAHKKDKGDKS